MEAKTKKAKASKDAKAKELLPLLFEMTRLLKREIARDGVSMPTFLHVETLRFIEEEGTPSMREVADYLRIAPPSATALVNSFVKEGIIDRSADPEDRRIVRLSISTKGIRLLQDIFKKREAAFARIITPLSATDRSELARILTIITRT